VADQIELKPAIATDPVVVTLATAQQAELAERYGEDQPLVELHPDIEFLVLWQEGQAIGCVGLQPFGPAAAEIKRMYVVPAARGRGLSRLLLGAVENHARNRGLTALRLETGVKQAEAIGLYSRSGYREIPRYAPYENVALSVCFAKDLNQTLH
jgi:GNAT superfamily N-acetyltransferase